MKQYKYDEWDMASTAGGFDERVYVDMEGNFITGILEDFYGHPATKPGDERNSQYVKNGKRCQKPQS